MTFSFNLVVGIPRYHAAARTLLTPAVSAEQVVTDATPPAPVPAGDILTTPDPQETRGGG